uniref:Longitudinals lacking protein n=1 Tax=Phlebotomus kandelakii TaxID=1109342 RepID=A0A6B2EFY9_9DIPT
MDDDQQFCLRWNNHQSTLISVFDTLLENGTLVDCTLAAEGKFLKAHKVVLSACSPYFAALLSQQYDKHPIFILKDVKFQELRAMMDYMYRGEVNISQDQLAALLKAAESLQIKGLSDSRGSGGSGGSSQKADTSTKTHASVPAAKQTTAGLTIEQKRPRIEKHPATLDIEPDVSDSREGSTSPNSRKRKKVRRRSIETNNIGDNHDQHSNSSSHSMPHAASSTHSTSMPTITSATSSASVLNVTKKTDHQSHESKGDIERDVDDNGDDGADGGESHQQSLSRSKQQSAAAGVDADMVTAKDKMEHSTHSDMLLEPKNEYDESNEGNVEDLTLDDEELLDDLEQAGPSHGGEGSSQGYAQWQIERSQDEVFMGGQDSAGQHRDAQGYHGKMSPVSQQSEDDQPCDLRLLTPATCLRELAAAQPATAPPPFAMCPPAVASTPHHDPPPPPPPQHTLTPSLSALRGVRLVGANLTTPGGAYTCNRCGNSYARPHSLNRHIRFECGVEPKFECPVCHKKSKHKHNLVLHMRTHQNR